MKLSFECHYIKCPSEIHHGLVKDGFRKRVHRKPQISPCERAGCLLQIQAHPVVEVKAKSPNALGQGAAVRAVRLGLAVFWKAKKKMRYQVTSLAINSPNLQLTRKTWKSGQLGTNQPTVNHRKYCQPRIKCSTWGSSSHGQEGKN